MALISKHFPVAVWLGAALALGGRPLWALCLLTGALLCHLAAKGGKLSVSTAIGALWLGWTAFCTLVSASPALAAQPLLLLAAGIVFHASATSLREEDGAELFLRAITIAGFAVALILGAGALLGFPVKTQRMVFPPNPNYAAAMMALGFGSMTGLLLDDNYPRVRKAVVAVAALFTLAIIVMTNSRSALLAAGTCALAALLLKGKTRATTVMLAGIALAVALLPQTVISRVIKADEAFSFSRVEIWGAALETAAANPLSGIGPGNYEWGYFHSAFPAFDGFSYYGHWSGYAHSHPLQTAVETGIPGLLLFLIFFLRPLWRFADKGIRSPRKVRAAAVLCGLLAASLMEGVLLLPVLLLAAFGCAAILDDEAGENVHLPLRLLLPLLLVPMAAYIFARKTASLSAELGDVKKQPAAAAALSAMFPMNADYAYNSAQAALLNSPANPYRALALLDKAIALNPVNAQYRYVKAAILARLGDPTSEDILKDTLALEPNHLPALLELTRIKAGAGQMEAAARLLASFEKAKDAAALTLDDSSYGRQLRTFDPALYAALKQQLHSGTDKTAGGKPSRAASR